MTENGPIIQAVIGSAIGAAGLMLVLAALLWRSMSRQFGGIGSQLDTTNSRLGQLETRFDSRLERLESRIDDTNKRIDAIGRDIAELRDRTGTLEGTLHTFMNAGRSPNAA